MHSLVRRVIVPAVAVIAIAPVLAVSPASADVSNGVCDLPEVTSTTAVKDSAGTTIGFAQLRREKVSRLLSSYYRYCARFALTSAPAQPLDGTITVQNFVTEGSAPLEYSTDGHLTYPSFGLSSPIIDVKKGTVGYKASFRPAGTTPPPTEPPPVTTVCNLPEVTSSTNIKNSAGVITAVAQLRREKVIKFLGKSYYRYCVRLYLARPPAQPTIGVATLQHFPVVGSTGHVDYTGQGPITYVAPTDPAFATAGISSPIVDVKTGTVGYKISLKAAP